MEKSLFLPEYEAMVRLLRQVRREQGMTQEDLAERLGETQSFVSKCEVGGRRLDFVEVRAFCHALGIPFGEFVSRYEAVISKRGAESTDPANPEY